MVRPKDTDSFTGRLEERSLAQQLTELTTFIWDNYLEIMGDVEDIFLMGVGDAYLGVKQLLLHRCKRLVMTADFRSVLTPLRSKMQIEDLRMYQLCQRESAVSKGRQRPNFGNLVQGQLSHLRDP